MADFIFEEYDASTRPIVFKLRSVGMTLNASYLENYMTEPNIIRFEKIMEEAQKTGSLDDQHKAYARHLALSTSKVEAFQKKGAAKIKLPDKTEDERYAIFRRISFQDMQSMVGQMAADLNRPLDSDGTTSSDGPAPKGESETAPETPTDS